MDVTPPPATLDALRDTLIHDIAASPIAHASRLRSGFILVPPRPLSEWSAGWEHIPPLLYCHLQLYLLGNRIRLHPVIRPAHFLLLPPSLSPGTPIVLLPYATPAYFLAAYNGPTDALTARFDRALAGLGPGNWKSSYIIAWITVQNKQGEDKGIPAVWPAKLSLAFLPSSSSEHARNPLPYIPALPSQLQPSPSQHVFRFPLTRRSLTTDALRAFRTLTFSKSKDINSIALQVGTYVDAMAKEREKERERIRKEREIASPKVLATTPTLIQPVPPPPPPTHPIFYPTPPQTTPSVQDPPPSMPPPPQPSFDPFPNVDSSWAHSTNDSFMNMDFTFGMDMDTTTGASGAYDRASLEYEDAFTDDDFSFFDPPSRTIAPPVPSSPHLGSGLTPAAGPAPLGFSPTLFGDVSGPGPPTLTPGQPSPWVSAELAEGFSPRFTHQRHSSLVEIVPRDLSQSPRQALPSPHSAPPSPNIQLSHAYSRTSAVVEQLHGRSSLFDPIPFASTHRIADGKYAIGKFALPSPPDEEDRTEPFPSCLSAWPDRWRVRYSAATDPRVGVVKKLIGVKRKIIDGPPGGDRKMSSSWIQEHEEWESTEGDESEDEGESEEEEEEEMMTESPPESRPSTPVPAYLPMGPALLSTRFKHALLLPLSTPLRPPGAAVAPTSIATTAGPTSVPTPVSPAAAMGAASEKSKSLEGAAGMVAIEVVENGVWADAWRACAVGATAASRNVGEVWQKDIKTVKQLLAGVGALDGLEDMFRLDSDSSEKLESPMISVGKGDAIIQIFPTALRFWEKLGLGPKGGKKDVTAFVLFEPDLDERQLQVEAWLTSLAAMYAGKHLGTHTAGISSSCPKDGIVPFRFDSFRKNLGKDSAFIPTLPVPSQTSLVLYVATPAATMNLASPLLRQMLSAVKRTLKTYTNAQLLFQFVPEQLVLGSFDSIGAWESDLETLCFSVYNRILRPVDRLMSRQLSAHGVWSYFQEPAFTLVRPVHSKVKLVWQAPGGSLDVLDRHTLLHVGYQITPCGKWILAACVDQRGEAHDLGVWLTQSEGREAHAVAQVWGFAMQFARRANVEWRIVIAKLGAIGATELEAWMLHLVNAVPRCRGSPMIHVSLLSIEADLPWSLLAPQRSATQPKAPSPNPGRASSKEKSGPIFMDVSATTYALFHLNPLPLTPTTPWARNLSVDLSFVPETDEAPSSEDLSMLPLSTATLVRVPSDAGESTAMLHLHLLHTIESPGSSLGALGRETLGDVTRNYYELAVLAGATGRLAANPILPFHLAAVDAMHVALARGDSGADN